MDRGTHTTATALIDAVRERTQAARVAEAAAFVAVGDWAAAHTSDQVVGDPIGALGMWLDDEHAEALAGDHFLELGGPGAPVVAEFCISEIAAARGCSFDAARRLVGDAVELRWRLPRVHARIAAGEVDVAGPADRPGHAHADVRRRGVRRPTHRVRRRQGNHR